MNKYTKMTLMRSAGRQERRDEDRREYDRPGMRGGYGEPESRFRDRDGREHYDDGRFAPMSRGGDRMPMDRIPMDRVGYPRADYMEPYSHHGTGWPMTPYVPPVYQREDWQTREEHWPREDYRPMNKIGFSVGGEMERLPRELGHEYRASAGYDHTEEMAHHPGGGFEMVGHPKSIPAFSRQMAEEWTKSMENADGSKGPHFSLEKIKQEMEQRGIKCDLYKFWAVINSIWSDDVTVAKKHNVNTMDYYIDRALAWLKDEDAVQDKAAAYYTYVFKR